MDKNVIQAAFEKHGSDKAQHGYAEFYAEHLNWFRPIKILEIGVKEGNSIRAWKELFPESEIHGLDLFQEFSKPDIPGVTLHKGNQCDWRILEQLRTYDFDIIIDDGSHNSRDQMITFFGLFNGKDYFIEDQQCQNEQYYSQGLPNGFNSLGLFEEIIEADVYYKKIVCSKWIHGYKGKGIITLISC